MAFKLSAIGIILWLLSSSSLATPKVCQSLVVHFPVNGQVIVQAREEVGKFPVMLFIAKGSGKVLLSTEIQDDEKWLISEPNTTAPSNLRFRVIRSKGFDSPLIMSVGAFYGGSDSAYFLTVFGEVEGKITRLNNKPVFANIQGGYYLGFINSTLGYGLVAWNFIWGNEMGECHYCRHKYETAIYKLRGLNFDRVLKRVSKKMYDGDGVRSLHELGIKVHDQRRGIQKIKNGLL